MAQKILFIDDEEDIRFVIRILLTRDEYTVDALPDIDTAGHLENGPYPDLYLLDRHVYGKDMVEFCKQLKAFPPTSHIPVVMISADPYIANVAPAASADAYVMKPFKPEIFLNTIRKLLPQAP